VVGYRLIKDESIIFPRSYCPHCKSTLAWYENIPVISWLFLQGKCAQCKQSISLLYPFIELLTAICLTLLWQSFTLHYFFSYFLFFSALIITIRSDLETMLISRYATLFLIPVGWFLSFFDFLPIRFASSIIGTILGYFILWFLRFLFKRVTGKEGMGQGDLELLAFIGSFIGIFGVWFTILIGSILGSLIGIIYLYAGKKSRTTKIPFGPFLALAAIIYVLWQNQLLLYILKTTY
jgi:leader peptidase (prepilin peptidase)/N-methyltransferase